MPLTLPLISCFFPFQFFYDLFGILFSSNELLVRKPIEAWSPSDVSVWVSGLGPWAKEINESRFQEMGINGKILKSLTESDLEDLLGIEKPYQQRALLSEIDHVKMLGVKAPADLWEYKVMYENLWDDLTLCLFSFTEEIHEILSI